MRRRPGNVAATRWTRFGVRLGTVGVADTVREDPPRHFIVRRWVPRGCEPGCTVSHARRASRRRPARAFLVQRDDARAAPIENTASSRSREPRTSWARRRCTPRPRSRPPGRRRSRRGGWRGESRRCHMRCAWRTPGRHRQLGSRRAVSTRRPFSWALRRATTRGERRTRRRPTSRFRARGHPIARHRGATAQKARRPKTCRVRRLRIRGRRGRPTMPGATPRLHDTSGRPSRAPPTRGTASPIDSEPHRRTTERGAEHNPDVSTSGERLEKEVRACSSGNDRRGKEDVGAGPPGNPLLSRRMVLVLRLPGGVVVVGEADSFHPCYRPDDRGGSRRPHQAPAEDGPVPPRVGRRQRGLVRPPPKPTGATGRHRPARPRRSRRRTNVPRARSQPLRREAPPDRRPRARRRTSRVPGSGEHRRAWPARPAGSPGRSPCRCADARHAGLRGRWRDPRQKRRHPRR